VLRNLHRITASAISSIVRTAGLRFTGLLILPMMP
jgi:hypothetical protein